MLVGVEVDGHLGRTPVARLVARMSGIFFNRGRLAGESSSFISISFGVDMVRLCVENRGSAVNERAAYWFQLPPFEW